MAKDKELIGEGGYGKVYRNRKFPGLVYKETRLWDESTTARDGELYGVNVREAVILCSLRIPGVIRASRVIYDKGVRSGGKLSVVMADGGESLPVWLKAKGETADKMSVYRQIVCAVYDLWCVGIQQIDLVPDNIVVDKDGVVRIIDIGLTSFRLRDGEWSDGFGSWSYCPPEVVLTDAVTDTTPVWNLAMLACFLWTDENPVETLCDERGKISSRKVVAGILRDNRNTRWSEKVGHGIPSIWVGMFDHMTDWKAEKRMSLPEVYAIVCGNLPGHDERSVRRGVPILTYSGRSYEAFTTPAELAAMPMAFREARAAGLSLPQLRVFPYGQWLWERFAASKKNGHDGRVPELNINMAVACLAWGQVLIDPLSDGIVRSWCGSCDVSSYDVANCMLTIADELEWCILAI